MKGDVYQVEDFIELIRECNTKQTNKQTYSVNINYFKDLFGQIFSKPA